MRRPRSGLWRASCKLYVVHVELLYTGTGPVPAPVPDLSTSRTPAPAPVSVSLLVRDRVGIPDIPTGAVPVPVPVRVLVPRAKCPPCRVRTLWSGRASYAPYVYPANPNLLLTESWPLALAIATCSYTVESHQGVSTEPCQRTDLGPRLAPGAGLCLRTEFLFVAIVAKAASSATAVPPGSRGDPLRADGESDGD